MTSQTKIQEIESDMHDLVMKNKINGLHLINCLFHLKITLKMIDKISIVKDLEINNRLKELETEKMMNWNYYKKTIVWSIKNRFWGRPNSIEEEIELKKQTRKKIDNIERLKTEVEEWEFKSVKLLQHLNYETHVEIARIARKEKRLEALKT